MSGRAFYRYQPLFAAHIIHRRQTAHSLRRDDFVRQTVNRAAQHIFSVIYIHLDEIFADVYVDIVNIPLHIFLKNFEMFCIGINPHGA